MLFNKTIKEENIPCIAHTIGDLIRNFNLDIHEFFIFGLDRVHIHGKYDVLFDKYYVIEFEDIELEDNDVHVFSGFADTPKSSTYTIIFDMKRCHIYSIGHSKFGNIVQEYDFNGILINE